MQGLKVSDSDYNIWVLLHQTTKAVNMARGKELSQFGIRPMQAAVLVIIKAIGNKATPSEISRWLFRRPHTVSSILARMESEGLIRRVNDLKRKNMVRVVLTKKGQQTIDQAKRRETIHDVMSILSSEERQQLVSCLDKLLNRSLIKLGLENKPPFPYT
jgi:DNA-binding MarR family transcriptional regulator